MSTNAPQQLISPAAIARLAEVSPSTVSSWRTRDREFPQPENDNPARPLFSVDKVTAWLKARNKKFESPSRSDAHVLADSIRGTVTADRFIEVLLPLLCAEQSARNAGQSVIDMMTPDGGTSAHGGTYDVSIPLTAISRELARNHPLISSALDRSLAFAHHEWEGTPLLEQVCMGIARMEDLPGAADDLIEATARNAKSALNVHSAPQVFAEFLQALLPAGGTTFADLACGFGQTLTAAAASRPDARLFGVDVDESALTVTACRMFLKNLPADLQHADLLQSDPSQGFDRVALHPPFGLRVSDAQFRTRQWTFGAPLKGQSDLLWPQAVYQELSLGGHGVVVLPTSALTRSGKVREIWGRMVSQGAIETVISLPANTQLNTALPVSVLVLSKAPHTRGVLMVHLAETAAFSGKRTAASDENQRQAYSSVVKAVSDWRAGASGTTDISLEVPKEKLLSPDAVMAPQTWLAALKPFSEDHVDQLEEAVEGAASRWETSIRTLAEPPASVLPSPTETRAVPLRPISELAECIPHGSYYAPRATSGGEPTTTKVFTPRSLLSGEPELLPEAEKGKKSPVTTRAGDVLVGVVQQSLRALVCTEEAIEVDRNIGVIRPSPNTWDPHFLACQLMTDHNQAMLSGGATARIDIRHLLVPQIPLTEQEAAGRIIQQFTRFTAQARAIAADADSYLAAFREALASGSFTIPPGS